MPLMTIKAARFVVLLLLLPFSFALASNQSDIEAILNQEEAPFGVVFEIVTGSDNALEWAIPRVNGFIEQLRGRFPDIDIAVVTHGSEQFGLLKSEAGNKAGVHRVVQSLASSDVPIHVCGTHALWRGKHADDFPDFVDVTPAGPNKIRDYQFMGYDLIKISSKQ